MNRKQFMLAIILFGSMLSSAYVHAIDYRFDFKQITAQYPITGRAVTILFLAGSIGRLFWRDSKPKPHYRYDLKKLIDPALLLSNPKEYAENIYYTWDDGFVGQCFKDNYLKSKPDGIKASKKCPPSGVLGYTFSALATTKKTQEMMEKLVTIFGALYTANFLHYLVNPHLSHLSHGKDKGNDPQLIQALNNNTQVMQALLRERNIDIPTPPAYPGTIAQPAPSAPFEIHGSGVGNPAETIH